MPVHLSGMTKLPLVKLIFPLLSGAPGTFSAPMKTKEIHLSLEQNRKEHESVFIHKALTKNSTPNLHQEYSNYQSKANTNTRRFTSGKLTIPSHNTSKFKKSPLYRTISTWNSIPTTIPTKTIKGHKTQYQNYLINQTHHSK